MNPHHFGFCQCPHCPQNRQNNLGFAPNWNANWGILPNFQAGCPLGHCSWCELWYQYAPYLDFSDLEQDEYWHWMNAHDFFRAVPHSPLRVWASIRQLIDLVKDYMRYSRSFRLRGLLYRLQSLAEDVRGGRYAIARGSPFHGRPGLGFGKMPMRLLQWSGGGGL